jgi:hypothetical protein
VVELTLVELAAAVVGVALVGLAALVELAPGSAWPSSA